MQIVAYNYISIWLSGFSRDISSLHSLFISWTAPNFHLDRFTFSDWSRVRMWCFDFGLSSQFHITVHWIKICSYINAVKPNDKFIKVAPADGSFSTFSVFLWVFFSIKSLISLNWAIVAKKAMDYVLLRLFRQFESFYCLFKFNFFSVENK